MQIYMIYHIHRSLQVGIFPVEQPACSFSGEFNPEVPKNILQQPEKKYVSC